VTPKQVSADVIVIGRANIDLTVRVPYLPVPGQTAIGSALVAAAGGKSLNQAIAVARLGGRSSLVANAGDDHWGHQVKNVLVHAGVDTTHMRLVPGAATGAAIVEVTPDGDNAIVLAVSPDTELTPSQITSALAQPLAPVMVIQLDMPPELITAALDTATPPTVRVGNLVPHDAMDRSRMRDLDVFVVNHHEAAETLRLREPAGPEFIAEQLRSLGPAAVVVTAGAAGAAFSSTRHKGTVPATPAPVADTTGAGDAFLGALALALAQGAELPDAVTAGVKAGTLAVQHHGAHWPSP
jgi:ribokinase